jgi:ABC-type glycerol-3-phosphate transport system permease component
MLFPLIRCSRAMGLFGTLPGIVLIHTLFGMPVMTLLFRNYYAACRTSCSRRRASTAAASGASSCS